MTKAQVKSNVHNAVTTKTATNSISPTDVGQNMEDIIDLIPDLTVGPQGPIGLTGSQGPPGNDGATGPQGEQGIPGINGDGVILYLPTPQIAKRKIFLTNPTDPKDIHNYREDVDGISQRGFTRTDLLSFQYIEDYYKEQFDIYFNLFASNTNNWLSLPDKRIELCMVSNKNYKYKNSSGHNVNITKHGNKDSFTNAIVHPSNYKKIDVFNQNQGTIYSSSTDTVKILTEWDLDETTVSFGDNIYGSGLNRLNNPNITIELDVRDFFTTIIEGARTGVQYPFNFTNYTFDPFSGQYNINAKNIRVKKIGKIKYNTKRTKVYPRNSVLFFRLSAGVVGSEKVIPGDKPRTVYTKRLFSDISQPIYICPKIASFYDRLGDFTPGTFDTFMFGHTTKIGTKN
jgi:hypothetical protein